MIKILILTITLLSGLGLKADELKTVDYVDLNKYIGKWFEIASIPQSFQKQCVKNVTAEYSVTDDKLIKVLNSCEKSDGTISVAEGRAQVVDKVSNSKLKVTFVKIFGNYNFILGGKYWIIDLESNYRYSLIGHPDLSYAWILSRTPSLSSSDLSYIQNKFKSVGYDTCKIMMTIQDKGNSIKKPLCKL